MLTASSVPGDIARRAATRRPEDCTNVGERQASKPTERLCPMESSHFCPKGIMEVKAPAKCRADKEEQVLLPRSRTEI